MSAKPTVRFRWSGLSAGRTASTGEGVTDLSTPIFDNRSQQA